MKMHLIYFVISAAALTTTVAQYPRGCSCPEECDCVVRSAIIDCTSQGLTYVPREINSCPWPGITKVDLSQNNITTVEALVFSQLGNITDLYLYDNAIQTLDAEAFVGLDSLQYLYLDGNQLTELHYNVFTPLHKLQRLLLYSNRLTSLPPGLLAEQSQLTLLALHDNHLTFVDRAMFQGATFLNQLYLHGNLITDLSNSPFQPLGQLRTLYLSDNLIGRLTRWDFLGLGKLTFLVLSNNKITYADDESFSLLLNLEQLHLNSNKLTRITRLLFAGPVKLLQLHVNDNRLQTISDGAFFRLRNLQTLSLINNQISAVTPQTFVGLDSLKDLVLYYNEIHQLQNRSFVQSPLMERLWLYENRIACLEAGVFEGLTNLQILHLGNNYLSYLPEDIFQPMSSSLVYLLLYGNQFTSIGNRLFKNMPNLIQLSLSYNSIEYIAEGALDGADRLFYFQWNELDDFSSLDNTLVCDCSSLWLREWMLSRSLSSTVLCASPEQFRGYDIRELQSASFGCSSVSLELTAGPSCENHVVKKGGCLVLECVSTPRTLITWSRVDGRPIRSLPHSCVSSSCQSGGDGVLVVENVREEDASYYMCTASIQGITSSTVCRVTLGDPPELLEEPEDEIILEYPGPPAILHLHVTGTPTPTVQWYHNGGRSGEVVAVRETGPSSRFLVSGSGALIITETRQEDEGVYRAVASNGAGEVQVDMTLVFYFTSACRRDCLNGGSCIPIHFCYCPENYEGRQCELYTGPATLPPPTQEYGSGTDGTPDNSASGDYSSSSADYSDYSSDYSDYSTGSGDYSGSGSGDYSGSASGDYSGTGSDDYSGSGSGDYSGSASGDYSGSGSGDYSGSGSGDYSGSGSGDYSGTKDPSREYQIPTPPNEPTIYQPTGSGSGSGGYYQPIDTGSGSGSGSGDEISAAPSDRIPAVEPPRRQDGSGELSRDEEEAVAGRFR